MKQKFDLLSDVGNGNNSQKQSFQEYEASLGFEKAIVLVPLHMAEEFERIVFEQQPKSVAKLKRIVEAFGGEVK